MQQALQIAIQHHQAGRLREAAIAYQQALQSDPLNAEISYNMGVALHMLGDLNGAISAYQHAVQHRPDFVEALNNLSSALLQTGRPREVIAVCEQAIRFHPEVPESYQNLGSALRFLDQPIEAIAAYRRAISLRPQFRDAWNNLGDTLTRIGELDDAIAAYRNALAIDPTLADLHYNLANALGTSGQSEASIASYRQALKLRPDWAMANSNLLFALHYPPGSTAKSIYEEHKQWNQRHALPLLPAKPNYPNDRSPERRLRIGYVSPDFYQHCQSLFTIPLLSNHHHDQFEIFCYADVRNPDSNTQRIKSFADTWRSTVGMSDEQLASLIKSDRIDILVDLTMHMRFGRPFVFARKPAPVQVAWLAYPSTTGLTAIDYRLTDPQLDPIGMNDAFYAEQSVRLPHTFWCFDALVDIPVSALPADSTKYITFGCLNNFLKINPDVLKLWSSVLREVSDSRMLIMAPKGSCRQRVIDGLGVGPERVQFVEFQPRGAYLRTYHRIDIGLDTFPYNGHTTSLDAYWMGVPVVTLCGQTAVSRAGFSQYSNLGLTDLVAHEPNDFVRIAVELANDLPRLRELRSTLRSRVSASPLMDGKRFAADVEAAFRTMWRKWCSDNRQT